MKINKVIKKNALPSFCSSNSIVLSNLIKFCKFNNLPILIESTSNQVNQFGGYSKKTPNAFIKTVKRIARKENFNLKIDNKIAGRIETYEDILNAIKKGK